MEAGSIMDTNSLESNLSNDHLTPKSKWSPNGDHAQDVKYQTTEETQDKILKTPNSKVKPSPFLTPVSKNPKCMPNLTWADTSEMWKSMIAHDEINLSKRSTKIYEYHPLLTPDMRRILLEWLSEVAEALRFYRESYFLAIDLLDRYLTIKRNYNKNAFQLLGITCLFIATKIEEVIPTRLHDFVDVTDGSCNEISIVYTEIDLLSTLDWQTKPITINSWLLMFLQLAQLMDNSKTFPKKYVDNFYIYPQYSISEYEEAVQICSLALMDSKIFNFSYRVIAASALHYVWGKDKVCTVTNMSWKSLKSCVRWLYPYVLIRDVYDFPSTTIQKNSADRRKTGLKKRFPKIVRDDAHLIQMHVSQIKVYEDAQKLF